MSEISFGLGLSNANFKIEETAGFSNEIKSALNFELVLFFNRFKKANGTETHFNFIIEQAKK